MKKFNSAFQEPSIIPAGSTSIIYHIRSARMVDLPDLAELLTYCFHSFQGIFSWMYPLVKLGIYEDLRIRLNQQSSRNMCLVAVILEKNEERVVGTAELSIRTWAYGFAHQKPKKQYIYISNLAVGNNYRRIGIARQLLNSCEQIAKDLQFDEIFLHVLADNHQAWRLYTSSGYQLKKVEFSLIDLLWNKPKRLLLGKYLN